MMAVESGGGTVSATLPNSALARQNADVSLL
jgi:hypothetical protein